MRQPRDLHRSSSKCTSCDVINSPFMLSISFRVTTGLANTLFHFVDLDGGRGLLVTPSEQQTAASPLHSQLLHNFHTAALRIKKHFDCNNMVRNKAFFFLYLQLL